MKILRYTEEVQKQLGSKTKPEPWLHVAIDMPKDQGSALYAIYVWDTREVVEEGDKMIWNVRGPGSHQINGTSAKDNHQPLVGLNRFADYLAFNFAVDPKLVTMYKQGSALYDDYIAKRKAFSNACSHMRYTDTREADKAHDTMMRTVQKLANFGYKHDIPEWKRFDGRRDFFRDEEVPWPEKLRKLQQALKQ